MSGCVLIVGMGYVGLPLALRFSEVGSRVIGLDANLERVDLLNKGISFDNNIKSERVEAALDRGIKFSSNFADVGLADAIVVCVPTPLSKNKEPDLSFVTSAFHSLMPYVREGQLFSLESTTYPGTTDEVIAPSFEENGWSPGHDIFLVYSPEREDPGNKSFSISTTPKVVGGYSERCLSKGVELYEKIVETIVPVGSTKIAEFSKLLENIYRSVNIGLVNEMKIIADQFDIDIFEVIAAAKTKPFGFSAFYPGPGLGGHCIPVDPFYLSWKARERVES